MKRVALYALAVVAAGSILVAHGMTSVTRVEVMPTVEVYRVWTDTERRFNGNIPIVRCTYHQSDGTARVVETVGTGGC